MYALVLLLHSWLRWVVLGTLGACLVGALLRARARRDWSIRDRRLLTLFIAAFDTQLLLGLTLYFVLSPITPKSVAELGRDMSVAYLRFFALEHWLSMLLALTAAHVTLPAARRAKTAVSRQRRLGWGLGLTLLLILSGVPWPFLVYGRPLFRGF